MASSSIAPQEPSQRRVVGEDRRHHEEQRHIEEVGLEAQDADQQVGQRGVEDLQQAEQGARRPARRRDRLRRLPDALPQPAAVAEEADVGRPAAGRPWRSRPGPGRRGRATCGSPPRRPAGPWPPARRCRQRRKAQTDRRAAGQHDEERARFMPPAPRRGLLRSPADRPPRRGPLVWRARCASRRSAAGAPAAPDARSQRPSTRPRSASVAVAEGLAAGADRRP